MYIVISCAIVIIGAAIAFIIQKYFLVREMKSLFLTLSSQVMKNNNEEFLLLAQQKLENEQNKAASGLELKQKEISFIVQQLEKRLADYERLVRSFEKERDTKYGSLEEQLRGSVEVTAKLQQTTDKLSSILGNVKLRGQWGERMAEDILRYAGLQENVHYKKDTAQTSTGTRPDYTFLLPDGHKVNMDVKFPLDKYLKLQNIVNSEERKNITIDFLRDVKNRIKEIKGREYINHNEQTLNYVILFIPNEQVYGFINDAEPGLIDQALEQRVILCSPYTLYAVLAIVRQAFDNFYFARATQDIIKVIEEFTKTYEKFQKRFAELGVNITKTRETYDKISNQSYKMLNSKLRKIEQFRQGDVSEDLGPKEINDINDAAESSDEEEEVTVSPDIS